MAKHLKVRQGPWRGEGWDFGPGHPTLLFIPGLGEPRRSFRAIARHRLLRDAKVNVVLVSVPGNEGYPIPRDIRRGGFPALARSLDGILDYVRPDIVVGHSLGCNVAIENAYAGGYHGPLFLMGCPFSTDLDMLSEAADNVGADYYAIRLLEFQALINGMRLGRMTRLAYRQWPAWRVDGWADADADDWLWLDKALDTEFAKKPFQIERLRSAGNAAYLHYAQRDDPAPTKKQLAETPNVTLLRRVKGKHSLQQQSTGKAVKRILRALDEQVPPRA
jgi:hypothetical protein